MFITVNPIYLFIHLAYCLQDSHPSIESLSQQRAIRQRIFGRGWLCARRRAVDKGATRMGFFLEKCISQEGRRAPLPSSPPAPQLCLHTPLRQEGRREPPRNTGASTGRGEQPGAGVSCAGREDRPGHTAVGTECQVGA